MSGPGWHADHPLIGRVLGGRFQVASFIREGGMAQVFCGAQPGEPRHVAIKVVHPELVTDREIVARFLREAKVASRLDHPNIVRTIDVGQDGDLLYMVMELLLGDDLSARVKLKGSFHEQRSVEIVIDMLEALHYAHQKGVVHRDIKPENVVLCRQPQSPTVETVKVLDFGIAKVLDDTSGAALPTEAPTSVRSVLTRVGTWVGTPAYMSPEQGRADPVDHRSDIYSAAVLLYELLCGRPPFEGETPLQIVARHVHEPPPPLHPWNPNVHPILEGLVLRALDKDPAARPATAHEMAAELRSLLPELGLESSQRWSTSEAPSAAHSAGPSSAPMVDLSTDVAVRSNAPSSASMQVGVNAPAPPSAGPPSVQALRQMKTTLALDAASVATALEAATAQRSDPTSKPRTGPHPLIGRILGERFQVASFVREGGMAQVFCGLSDQEPHHVAIKVVHPELARDPQIVARFLREAQIASRLNHPNIIRIVAVGEDRDLLYMVMELLFGDDLSARIKQKGTFTQERAVQIASELCSALHYAHQHGVIHRDIKPENIMLCRQPDSPAQEVVKVLDFGIAKVLDDTKGHTFPVEAPTAVRSVLTRVGALVGTPTYVSPEQGRAEVVDHRSDIYSVGVLLYELLCGRPPFEGETALQIVARHVHDKPPPPSSLVTIPSELEQLLLQTLAKDPAHRPQTAADLGYALEDVARRLAGQGVGPTQRSQRDPLVAVSVPTQPIRLPVQTPAAPPRPSPSPPPRPDATPLAAPRPPTPPHSSTTDPKPLAEVKRTLPISGVEADAIRRAAADAIARQRAQQAQAPPPPIAQSASYALSDLSPRPPTSPPPQALPSPIPVLANGPSSADLRVNKLVRVVMILGALLVVTLTVVGVLVALVLSKR